MVGRRSLAKRSDTPMLTLVLPVYNYGSRLRANMDRVMTRLRKEKFQFELVLVNDGSKDKTGAIMKKLSKQYREIRIISYPKNRGKGYAVKQGMLNAHGRFVFFTDVDIPYGLEPIFEGMEILKQGEADVVLGSRDLSGPPGSTSYSLGRKITKKLFSVLVNSVLKLGITDTQCGLKGFRKEVAKDIFSRVTIDDFCFDVEAIYIAKARKYGINLIPVSMKCSSDQSTVSIFRDSMKMLVSLIRILFNHSRPGPPK